MNIPIKTYIIILSLTILLVGGGTLLYQPQSIAFPALGGGSVTVSEYCPWRIENFSVLTALAILDVFLILKYFRDKQRIGDTTLSG